MATRTATPTVARAKRPGGASRLSIGFRPTLTLHTFLDAPTTNPQLSMFIHAAHGLTLVDFLDAFRAKHRIDASVHLLDMHLTLGDMILGINLDHHDRDWDWEALMAHFGKTEGLVKVVIRAG